MTDRPVAQPRENLTIHIGDSRIECRSNAAVFLFYVFYSVIQSAILHRNGMRGAAVIGAVVDDQNLDVPIRLGQRAL